MSDGSVDCGDTCVRVQISRLKVLTLLIHDLQISQDALVMHRPLHRQHMCLLSAAKPATLRVITFPRVNAFQQLSQALCGLATASMRWEVGVGQHGWPTCLPGVLSVFGFWQHLKAAHMTT